jgi:hypothetical protein
LKVLFKELNKHGGKANSLKGPSDQIRSARECHSWIGLSKGIHHAIGFFIILNFDLEFIKSVQSTKVLNVQIYLISGLRGQQAVCSQKALDEGLTKECPN